MWPGQLGARDTHIPYPPRLDRLFDLLEGICVPPLAAPFRRADWDGKHFNSGVMVFRGQDTLFGPVDPLVLRAADHWIYEEFLFNAARTARGMSIAGLGNWFNGFHCRPQVNRDVHFFHYLGTPGRLRLVKKDAEFLQLSDWRRR